MLTTIAKNPGIPLLSSVSRSTKSPISVPNIQSFSLGYFSSKKTPFFGRRTAVEKLEWKCTSHLIGLERRSRGLCTISDERRRDSGGMGGRRLPWIASSYGKKTKVFDKKSNASSEGKSSKSSWEESAAKFLSKKESDSVMEDGVNGDVVSERSGVGKGSLVGTDEFERESEEEEAVDDPRWDKIKNKYVRFVERESRPERPEVIRWNKQENWGRKTWREAKESSVPKMVGEGVYGVGPILAALTVGRRDFYALHVQEGLGVNVNKKKRKDKKAVENILKMAQNIGLTVKETSKHDLNMVVDNRPHQGLILDASPLEMVGIKELDVVEENEGGKTRLWVALDEVTDPQNLGTILRSSYFFGVEGVVVCAKNSAPLSGVVSKASAGALELVELRSCKNMMQFLTSSAENGWRVLGGSVSSKSVPLNEVPSGVPTILVLGSEGTGLRPLVERSCSQLIRIPGKFLPDMHIEQGEDEAVEGLEHESSGSGQELKSFLAVESLNVSVATGVLLYHLVGSNFNHVADPHQL